MQKAIEVLKNIVLTTGGIITLLVVVYVGAVGFLTAVIVDKLLQAFGSGLTVDKILSQFESMYHSRYDGYRQSWEKFHFKDLKLPF